MGHRALRHRVRRRTRTHRPAAARRDTTWYGLPTGLTWTTIRLDLVAAWDQFSVVKAPVPAEAGFLAGALIAVWIAAWIADTFAFRFDAVIEAIVPTAGIFLFVSVLSRPDYRLFSCAVYFAAALAFIAAPPRVARRASSGMAHRLARSRARPRC